MKDLFSQLIADKLKIFNGFVILAVLISAMLVVYSKYSNRLLFVKLESLVAQRDQMNIEWGQLQLEQSTWATNSRIEKIATEKLHMRNVEYKNTVIIKL